MKLAKFLLLAIVVAAGFIIYLVLRPSKTYNIPENRTINGQQQNFWRGDDPTYAEEVRKSSALTLETQRQQQVIRQELEDAKSRLESENARLHQQLENLLGQMSQLRNEITGSSRQNVEQASQALEEKISELNNLTVELQEQIKVGEAHYQELLDRFEKNRSSTATENNVALQTTISPSVSVPLQEPTPTTKEEPVEKNFYAVKGSITPYVSQTNGSSNTALNNRQASNSIEQWMNKIVGGNETTISDANSNPRLLPQAQVNQKKEEWPTVFPVYTLPPNTVLQAKLITPVIGRVPIGDNTIEDPFFFRLQIGSENLAANGHHIPGISGMIASGYATGIREQQCARGYIDSLTFIFVDGRIANFGKNAEEGSSHSESLGYLSDAWGKPCIQGQYIDNASGYLKSRGAAAFLEAAAEGLSQGQVSYRQNSDGNYTAMLDGNVWRFVFGRGISGTATEFADYVRERTANAFDVVYVEQGQNVQIMLNAMVPIDYDANARKVNYYSEPNRASYYD